MASIRARPSAVLVVCETIAAITIAAYGLRKVSDCISDGVPSSRLYREQGVFRAKLLNPGFETRMQVYADPKAKESNGGLLSNMAEGMEESYYVARGNSSATYVQKKKYKKSMSSVFDDCSTILEAYKPDFSQFAAHVFYYENECN